MIKALIGNGNGSFDTIHTLASTGGPNFLQVQNVNSDMIPDLVIGHSFLNSVEIAIGNGDENSVGKHNLLPEHPARPRLYFWGI